jgi:hypothetical protein
MTKNGSYYCDSCGAYLGDGKGPAGVQLCRGCKGNPPLPKGRVQIPACIIGLMTLLIGSTCFAGFQEDSLDLSRSNQQMHFAAGAGIALLSAQYFKAHKVEHYAGLGMLMGAAANVVKELLDKDFNTGDLASGSAGAAAGAVLSMTFTF